MIKLVLSDMDGTLVPFGRPSVSQRTLSAIRSLRSRGIDFGPASGREPVDLIKFFRGDASCFATGILANGKLVRKDGKIIFRRPVDREALMALGRLVAPIEDAWLLIYIPEGPLVERSRVALLGKGEAAGQAPLERFEALLPNGCEVIDDIPDCDIYTVGVACASPDRADGLRPLLEESCPTLDFVKPTPFFFDVLPKGTSKATALKVLQSKYAIRPEEVVFFGDSENDLALLEAVPNSIAVANGTPAAQEAARYHIADAADDSVAAVIESIARTGELSIPSEVSRD